MISRAAKKANNNAISIALFDAVAENGETFNSKHEAYGVLLEEWDEMVEECGELERNMDELRMMLRNRSDGELIPLLKTMEKRVEHAHAEMAQVAAMIKKFRHSVEIGYSREQVE